MLRTIILTFSIAIILSSGCNAQEASIAEPPVSSIASADGVELTDRIRALEERNDQSPDVADFLVLTFILLMFTNAVICGQWAISTNRSFWRWYLFGLFTGPLAGGFMLDRSARDRSGGRIPGGVWGAVAGLLIPFVGWIIWVAILR